MKLSFPLPRSTFVKQGCADHMREPKQAQASEARVWEASFEEIGIRQDGKTTRRGEGPFLNGNAECRGEPGGKGGHDVVLGSPSIDTAR